MLDEPMMQNAEIHSFHFADSHLTRFKLRLKNVCWYKDMNIMQKKLIRKQLHYNYLIFNYLFLCICRSISVYHLTISFLVD